MMSKRALIRAVEKQALLSKKIDDMRDDNTAATKLQSISSGPTPKRRMSMYYTGRGAE